MLKNIKVLAISFGYPPSAYPNSIQVTRLLGHLQVSTALVCADEQNVRRDTTMEQDAGNCMVKCSRIPFYSSGLKKFSSDIAHLFYIPLWGKTPDMYRSWKTSALEAVDNFMRMNRDQTDILVTFSHPLTDHLIGLETKRRYRLPWIAHFSDPWVDNPFNRYDPLTRAVNLSLERKVLESADRLVFTSEETVDLVMAKYPKGWKDKARVLPHSFDPGLYPTPLKNSNSKLMIRYVGNFYGRRTPRPLFRALHRLLSFGTDCLENVCFELIGYMGRFTLKDSDLKVFPEGLVTIKTLVNYRESLALMVQADGLIVIDAPAEKSIFLPSKLIDYTGSGRPILGLTPQGASATLIGRLGGWVADPADVKAMSETLQSFLSFLRQNRADTCHPWGDSTVRANYEVSAVARGFGDIIQELIPGVARR